MRFSYYDKKGTDCLRATIEKKVLNVLSEQYVVMYLV